MRLFLLLVLFISCGKNKESKKVHTVTPLEISTDSDGDGMADWDERYIGRDPFMADLNEELPLSIEVVTVIDNKSVEHNLTATYYRSLRMALLQEVGSSEIVSLPPDNRFVARLDHDPEFWRLKLTGTDFSKIRFNEKGYENAQTLQQPFHGHHEFVHEENIAKLVSIRKKTYRLVVSTPEREEIFHLSPHISIRDFVIKKYNPDFDTQNRVIALSEHQQSVDHQEGIDYQSGISLWRTVRMPLDLNVIPKLGETYALVFGKIEQFKQSTLNNAPLSFPHVFARPVLHGHESSFILYVPKNLKLSFTEKHETLPIRIGNGDRERTCEYTLRHEKGYRPYIVNSAAEILRLIQFSGAQNIKVEWFENGNEGAAAKISVHFPQGNMSVASKTELLAIGVVKSGCESHKPIKIRNYEIWQNLKGYLSWLPQS